MKYCVLPVLFFVSFFLLANGELSKDQKKMLDGLEISGVRATTDKDDNRNKFELLEITTGQEPSEDNMESGYRIHIVAELKDSEKNMYIVDFTGNRPDDFDVEYTGEDYWLLYMPHGELQRPKIDAYAIQYGFMDGEEFIVFAEEYKRCKTMDELTQRTTTPYPETVRLRHYYMYEDESVGETESISKNVRQIKTKVVSGSTDQEDATKKDEPNQE